MVIRKRFGLVSLFLFLLFVCAAGYTDMNSLVYRIEKECEQQEDIARKLVIGADEWYIQRVMKSAGWTLTSSPVIGNKPEYDSVNHKVVLGKPFTLYIYQSCDDSSHFVAELCPAFDGQRHGLTRYCFVRNTFRAIRKNWEKILDSCYSGQSQAHHHNRMPAVAPDILARLLEYGLSEFQVRRYIDSLGWIDSDSLRTQVYSDTASDTAGNSYRYETVADFRLYCRSFVCSTGLLAEFCHGGGRDRSGRERKHRLVRYCIVYGDVRKLWNSRLALIRSQDAIDLRPNFAECRDRILIRKAQEQKNQN